MARYVLLLYDDSVSYRSMTIPNGAEKLTASSDLESLASQVSAMAGTGSRPIADGGDGPQDRSREDTPDG